MDGMILFAKYAFAPNQKNYCGPTASRAIFDYLKYGKSDPGLEGLLKEFKGALPYLQFIAESNNIEDPFDWKVVEAYWIGNELLEKTSISDFYNHLKERFGKKVNPEDFEHIVGKLPLGAKPHHSLHVFEICTRIKDLKSSGFAFISTLDNCRISWGRVEKTTKGKIDVSYQPLEVKDKFFLGEPTKRKITLPLDSVSSIKKGDWVSFHWGTFCDILTTEQKNNLEKYTKFHISLENLIIL